jgi:hypothetical protein
MKRNEVQAFPRAYHPQGCGVEGMSLRDWFAGQAVAGLLAGLDRTKGLDLSVLIHEAFCVADGMIGHREK